ncbi:MULTISPECIES: metal-dependent hydrolase [Serratia]|uniref:Alanyl-tRNA editing protein n=1 Tax=Serratia rubidaea TaxID=61652 RepID=A0A3S5AXJ7_SERRU|nr:MULTISPECIES: metal-dependent hydrolase [Serratia]AGB83153.1 putative metal-dependent hydrolase related to alanyl-tRNA synthetase HxxxH domain protein [Serratia sp. FGI94]MBH1929633.1 alanyl-tRNA editing protein [Serratia rubidaea]MDC6118386.1 alanyl-tRNA editing protein [Serratia rubidaea]MEB7585222.1 alanyl-tRNA editing protein [Serratia rubidaea]VEI68297.1 alanyl-tRNA synthetase [Serratia rubidaea]
MTERRYYYSDELQGQAQLLDCRPLEDGNHALVLDGTLFHPQGGGQPADGGSLNGEPLLRLVPHGDDILHVVARPQPPGPVTLAVDGRLRALHARWHSAGHLIGYLGETQGWRPVKAHHWPGEGRITLAPGDGVRALEQAWLQQAMNTLIAADLPRRQQQENGVRQVGFGDLPAYGCGGTHVRSLAELGEVTISALKMKKGQLVVYYALA